MNKLILGNIDVERDWGFAGDYVVAMWKMLQISTPSDFVIATGKSHSVRDFLIKSSNLCGINNWNDVVQFSSKLNRSIDYQQKIGDFSKAKKFLKWTPKTNFNKLIKLMIDAEFTN